MEEIINEMDLLFKHVVKYYNMRDKKEVKKEWNSLVTEFEKCNKHIVIGSFCAHEFLPIDSEAFKCRKCKTIKINY